MVKDRKRNKVDKEQERKSNRKIKIFLLALLILIIVIGVLIFLIKPKEIKKEKIIGNFSFEGFNYTIYDFGKTNEGKKLLLYHTKMFFPKRNITYNLYLRYDPRKNNVNIDIKNLKEIKATTYIALDKNFDKKNCSELVLASYRLGEFLLALGVNKEVAIYYENYSLPTYKGFFVINSYNFSEKENVTVIILKYSNKEAVYNLKNTIIIQSNNCNILQPSERFILYVIKKLKKNGFVISL